jgi:dienelactone hydrolase
MRRLQFSSVALVISVLVVACQGARPSPSASIGSAAPSAVASPVASPVISTDPAVIESRYEAGLPLFDYDATAPLSLERAESVKTSGILREDISYASPRGGRAAAYLLRPATEGPHPGLILMHGSGGNRSDMLSEGSDYARLGVLVLLAEAPWARRDGEWIDFTERDRDEQIQLIVDLRRAVDVLIEVGADPERIGYLGYSYGAAMGGLLAGVEPRIRAFVLDVGDGGLVSHFTGPDDRGVPPGVSEAAWEAWLEVMEPIEPIYFIGHAAPGSVLMQSGRFDELVPAADAERWHETAGATQEVIWYDTGHELSTQAWCDGADWLRQHLAFEAGDLTFGCA